MESTTATSSDAGSLSDPAAAVSDATAAVPARPAVPVVQLTEAAAAKVRALLAESDSDGMMLRIAVRPGGCSGFSYEMFFDADATPDDVRTVQFGVPVVVDAASAQLLMGATLDYLDGLSGSGFKISNPSATRTCGCGSSFS